MWRNDDRAINEDRAATSNTSSRDGCLQLRPCLDVLDAEWRDCRDDTGVIEPNRLVRIRTPQQIYKLIVAGCVSLETQEPLLIKIHHGLRLWIR